MNYLSLDPYREFNALQERVNRAFSGGTGGTARRR